MVKRQAPTGGGGAAKLKRALNQINNARRLIASLPKDYDTSKTWQIASKLQEIENQTRELSPR